MARVISYLSHGAGNAAKGLTARKPPRKPPKPPAKPKAPAKPKTLTPEQAALQRASQFAEASIAPARNEILAAIEAAEDRRVMQMKAAASLTQALADMTKGDPEALRAAYADAAGRVGQYGAAFTGELRGLQEGAAAEANARISGLGLPGAVASTAPANANTAMMLGAVIPGETLAAQAPRAMEAAQARRLAGGLRVADQASLMDYQAAAKIPELRAEIEKLEGKRPGLIQEALDEEAQRANAKRATDTQIGYLQLQQAKTVQDQAIGMTNMTGSLHIVVGKGKNARVVNTGKPAMGSEAAVAQVRAETSRTNAAAAAAAREKTARINAQNRAANARIAADAKRDAAQIAANAKLAAARTSASKKTVSTAKSAADAQTKFVANATKYARSIAGVNEKTGMPRAMPPKRTSIMKSIVDTYGAALVGKWGITKPMVETWAHAIVMAFPNSWWQPSNYGGATQGGSSGGGSYTEGG